MSTLAQLRTRVREKVDESVASFWTDTVINNQLNEAYHFYWAFILELFEGHFATTSQISFDANISGEYTLPADFFKARVVLRNQSGQTTPLQYCERYDYAVANTDASSTFNLPTYRFRGQKLVFEPAPLLTETNAVTLEYIKTLTNLSASQDVDDSFPALAEDCMILKAVIKCKSIEEMVAGSGSDADPFISDLKTAEQLLKESMEQRTVARQYVEPFGGEESESNFFRY